MTRRTFFSRPVAWIISIVTLIVGSIVIGISYYGLAGLTFAGDRIIYGKRLSDLTKEIRMELLKKPGARQLSFKTVDNLTLSGILIERSRAKANLILCHGYKSAKELMYAYIDLFPNWNILLFDFRAHGQSEGKMTSIGCNEYKDVMAAVKFVRKWASGKISTSLPLIIMGISMGGAAALKAAETNPGLADVFIVDSSYAHLDATVLDTFTSKSSLPRIPFFPIIKTMLHYMAQCNVHDMNPAEYVKGINQPILFIHSCNDTYIPPHNSIALYANAHNKNCKLWIGPHCRHGWLHSYHSDLYKKKVNAFLKHSLPNLFA